MEWLNYHHLLYFWTVARLGSIAKASQELLLAPPTISAQISRLEDSLGEKLFKRSGRRLTLTEAGEMVFRYADEIFLLGRELTDTVKGRPTGRPLRLTVGIADVLPKAIVHRLIRPAFHLNTPVRVVCREDPPDRLVGLLAVQQLDLMLSDSPLGPGVRVRAFNHLLGECGVDFYGTPKEARRRGAGFPQSLNGAPMLAPTESASLRADLDRWFELQGIRPEIVAEFDDFSLLRRFAVAGEGLFAAPRAMEAELRQFGLKRIGAVESIRSRFYAISVEKKIKHPAVVAICESAREKLFRP